MSHTVSDDIAEALSRRGLTPRQRHLLTLRMIARGTEPDEVEIQGPQRDAPIESRRKLPWACDSIGGKKVPAMYRKPLVQTGAVPSRIRELANFTAGGERFVVLDFEGVQTDVDTLRDTLLAKRKGKHGGLDLPLHGRSIVRDLIEVGGSAIGFLRKTADGDRAVYSFARYPVEWLSAVHYVTRFTPRARQLAAEIAQLPDGAQLVDAAPDGLPVFRAPADALDDDLLFVRYEYEHSRQAVALRMGGTAKDDERVRSRRDFTVDAVVSYEDLVLGVDLSDARDWTLARPISPHNWGVVPIANAKADGGDLWDLEGEGLVEGAVESLALVNDRSASMLADAAWAAGDPTVVMINVRNEEKEVALEAGTLADYDLTGVGDKVMNLKSMRDAKLAKVELLEIDADGVEALDKQSQDIGRLLDRALGVTTRDPESMTGVLSGVALEMLNAPMVAQAETLRGFAGRCIAELERKLEVAMRVDNALGSPVTLTDYRWPRVFPFTVVDQKAAGEAISILLGSSSISQETAVSLAATVVGTKDTDAELALIRKANEEELAKAVKLIPPPLNDAPPDDPFNDPDDEA